MARRSLLSRIGIVPALLALLPFVAGSPLTAQASSADLLWSVPVVNEHAINNVACGQAAATMVLDYYLNDSGGSSVGIGTVARYVPFTYRAGSPTGTNPMNLASGLEGASRALGVPLDAVWEHTQSSNWRGTLRHELADGHPVIAYLSDGGMLWGGSWHYGHYIVVSGLHPDGSVIYHDPFDGRQHTVSADTFGRVWGNGTRRTWTYLHITPREA